MQEIKNQTKESVDLDHYRNQVGEPRVHNTCPDRATQDQLIDAPLMELLPSTRDFHGSAPASQRTEFGSVPPFWHRHGQP